MFNLHYNRFNNHLDLIQVPIIYKLNFPIECNGFINIALSNIFMSSLNSFTIEVQLLRNKYK